MPNLFLIVDILIIAVYAWAVLDALVRPSPAFDWAQTTSKPVWVGLLAFGLMVRAGMLPLDISFGSIVNLILVVMVVYYLGPIRSRMQSYPKKRRRERGSW